MKIETHTINNIKIAEVTAENIIIESIEDGSKLIANVYYQDFDRMILYEKNITPLFFDLKNGITGEILQKFYILLQKTNPKKYKIQKPV